MATKYCDAGLYCSAVAQGYISGTTMTLDAPSSGVVGVGAYVTGSGVTQGTYITANGTGLGGVGTYTVNQSQTVGSVGAKVTLTLHIGNPQAVPFTWGVAQEGDGTASGAATPATVSIDLSGATADANDTVTILGAVLTCVASGAGNNQFNAGSGSTLVSNLATAINRTTNTVTCTAQSTGWKTPKLQDAVFARVGTPNTTLDIMTRAGSATYNSSQVAQSGIAGITGPWTFSGGAGGAWGYIFNGTAAALPSGITAFNYGLLSAAGNLLAGVMDAGDTVIVRGGKKQAAFSTGTVTMTWPNMGSRASPVTFKFDDGTQWPADGSTPVFEIIHETYANSSPLSFGGSASTFLRLVASGYSDGTFGLKFSDISSSAGSVIALSLHCGIQIAGFHMAAATGTCQINTASGSVNMLGSRARLGPGKITNPRNNSQWTGHDGNPRNISATLLGIEFDATGSSAANTTGVLSPLYTSSTDYVEYKDCRFTNFITGSQLFTGVGAFGVMSFDGCDFGNVTLRGPYWGTSAASSSVWDPAQRAYTATCSNAERDFFFDWYGGFCDWNSKLLFPTSGALLEDGVTPWSIRVIPTTQSGNIAFAGPVSAPELVRVNSLADGARTFTLGFVAETSLTPTNTTVSMVVSYTDTNGRLAVVDSFGVGTVSTDTRTWSSESGGYVTFSNGGVVNHNKYKLTVSTLPGRNLKQDTEFRVQINVHASVADTTKSYFFDPSIGVA